MICIFQVMYQINEDEMAGKFSIIGRDCMLKHRFNLRNFTFSIPCTYSYTMMCINNQPVHTYKNSILKFLYTCRSMLGCV
jgi:hypothetical protein